MKTDFNTWWHHHHFQTSDPRYQIYRKLHAIGGDLDYIDFLSSLFSSGDRAMHQRAIKKKKRKWPPKGLTLQSLLDSVEEVEKILPSWEESKAKQKTLFRKLPILSVYDQYHYPQIGRGRSADSWGTFFLLGVTEHLRQKAGKPHHALAYRLLRALRPPSLHRAPDRYRISATVRVREFKRKYGTSAIKILNKQFLDQKRAAQLGSVYEWNSLFQTVREFQTLDLFFSSYIAAPKKR